MRKKCLLSLPTFLDSPSAVLVDMASLGISFALDARADDILGVVGVEMGFVNRAFRMRSV